jgi:hypothetical protein
MSRCLTLCPGVLLIAALLRGLHPAVSFRCADLLPSNHTTTIVRLQKYPLAPPLLCTYLCLQDDEDEYELDIDALDPVTCWKLQSYVDSVLAEQAAKQPGQAPPPTQPAAAAAAAAAAPAAAAGAAAGGAAAAGNGAQQAAAGGGGAAQAADGRPAATSGKSCVLLEALLQALLFPAMPPLHRWLVSVLALGSLLRACSSPLPRL